MVNVPGRYCQLNQLTEVSDLKPGMDFRKPEYRREVFHRFYEFHLKYAAHPGCVYYLFPWFAEKYKFTLEEKLWFAYLNGNTQNPVTTSIIYKRFPSFLNLDVDKLQAWFKENYKELAWDTDRRYFKKSFIEAVQNYQKLVKEAGGTQESLFLGKMANTPDEYKNFRQSWDKVMNEFAYFGRLSSFSYLEYLRIMGVPLDCNDLFLEDMNGSKSHRNGLCKVLGRDDLDWHDSNPEFDGNYAGLLPWLREEADLLITEAKERHKNASFIKDVSFFTLESTFCCYKSWHRPNRRYPNVYNDMLVNRIKIAEASWEGREDFSDFWTARKEKLPIHLRLEDNPKDLGLKPLKQNHYRTTGQVIMMDQEWDVFKNQYNDSH